MLLDAGTDGIGGGMIFSPPYCMNSYPLPGMSSYVWGSRNFAFQMRAAPGGHGDLTLTARCAPKDVDSLRLELSRTDGESLVAYETLQRMRFLNEENEGKKVCPCSHYSEAY